MSRTWTEERDIPGLPGGDYLRGCVLTRSDLHFPGAGITTEKYGVA